MITFKLLDRYTEITHFCTDRKDGVSVGDYSSFNMSPYTGDNPESIAENHKLLIDKLGIESEKLIIPFQTHGSEILEIEESFFHFSTDEKSQALHGIDALFTKLPNVCIGVTTADCVPLIFFDPQKHVVAIAHAGWRGTCAGIGEKMIFTLVDKFSCNPADIRILIGPSISVKAYEVGKEVVDNFDRAGFDISKITTTYNGSIFLDLWKANQLSAIRAGVLNENIEISGICTYKEHERFFSARRLGINSGRMLSGIMLLN